MKPFDVIRENLSVLAAEEARVTEKTLYELSELSSLLYERVKDDLFTEDAEALLHRGTLQEFLLDISVNATLPSGYAMLLKDKHSLSALSEVCAFAHFLSERIQEDCSGYTPWRSTASRGARIAYVPAVRTEKAYFALSALKNDASVLYVSSASDAVSELLANRADYALLPYVAAKGEPLVGIHRLAAQNDLYFSAIVTLVEGDERFVYALFSQDFAPFAQTDCMVHSFKITAESYSHLGRILSAIPVFGYTQTSLSTESEEYGRVRAHLSLRGDGDETALWIYFSLYAVGVSHLGRYPIIEIEER